MPLGDSSLPLMKTETERLNDLPKATQHVTGGEGVRFLALSSMLR